MSEQNQSPQNRPSSDKTPQGLPPQFRPSNPRPAIITGILLAVVTFLLVQQFFIARAGDEKPDELITSQFVQAVEQGRVTSVDYTAGEYTVSGTYYPAITAGANMASAFNEAFNALNVSMANVDAPAGEAALPGVVTSSLDSIDLGSERKFVSTYYGVNLSDLMNAHPEISFKVKKPSALSGVLMSLILPCLLIGILLYIFFSQMNKANNSQLSFGKTKARKNKEEYPTVKFDDVAGVDEAVEEMREVKDFLANPDKYQAMGAKIPRGCLLVGPPGTGKTLLAKAVAGEAGVPFFSISGSDFVEMFVGVGASRVRDLFQQAKAAAPAIIFIDEIDAVGRQRGTGLGGGHDEREQTLNQMLVEMDGFESNDSVVLIAATNRADILDPALLRPGRFDRQIVVDAPDVKGRQKILEVHSKGKPIGSDVDLAKVAQLTPGFTGADLANLMNESALLSARRNKKVITQQEVSDSMERVIAGPERKGRVMDAITKRTIAFHESGHALVGHLLPYADPVHKISIISRGRALGYTLSIPKEDKVLNSLREIRDELAVFMAGRVAEEIFCEDITTGASNDLERATKMARAMVTQYGMSSKLGTQVFGQPNHEVFLGRDYGNTQDYSDETARRIDEEVAAIMKEAHDRAYEILVAHQEQMNLMAGVLLDRETVEGEACEALLNNQWDEYLVHEVDIIARKEAEEAAARAKDEEIARAAAEERREEEEARQHQSQQHGEGQGPKGWFAQQGMPQHGQHGQQGMPPYGNGQQPMPPMQQPGQPQAPQQPGAYVPQQPTPQQPMPPANQVPGQPQAPYAPPQPAPRGPQHAAPVVHPQANDQAFPQAESELSADLQADEPTVKFPTVQPENDIEQPGDAADRQ